MATNPLADPDPDDLSLTKQKVRPVASRFDDGHWVPMVQEPDGTVRPATEAELAEVERELRERILRSARTVREGFDRIVSDPDFRPEPTMRYRQYVAWKNGVDRGYRPTMADLWMLAAEEQRKTYGAGAKVSGEQTILEDGEPAELPQPEDDKPTHSIDFRSVGWYGSQYTFTPTQAACVKVLWEQWEKGTPEIGEQTILEDERVESAQNRLPHVFNKGKHPAWRTMIVPGSTKGSFRLAEPDT